MITHDALNAMIYNEASLLCYATKGWPIFKGRGCPIVFCLDQRLCISKRFAGTLLLLVVLLREGGGGVCLAPHSSLKNKMFRP